LHLPWSNGPVEGQVHRLKLIKRQIGTDAESGMARATRVVLLRSLSERIR
jgi:hypothetical protein